jgi:hypothetical protein
MPPIAITAAVALALVAIAAWMGSVLRVRGLETVAMRDKDGDFDTLQWPQATLDIIDADADGCCIGHDGEHASTCPFGISRGMRVALFRMPVSDRVAFPEREYYVSLQCLELYWPVTYRLYVGDADVVRRKGRSSLAHLVARITDARRGGGIRDASRA